MISLLLLSHSREIAGGTQRLAQEMGQSTSIHAIGGTKDGSLGSDFDTTIETLETLANKGQVLVLYDLGSTKMTVDMAVETLEPKLRQQVCISNAAFVEGAVITATLIDAGLAIDNILGQLKELELHKG